MKEFKYYRWFKAFLIFTPLIMFLLVAFLFNGSASSFDYLASINTYNSLFSDSLKSFEFYINFRDIIFNILNVQNTTHYMVEFAYNSFFWVFIIETFDLIFKVLLFFIRMISNLLDKCGV